MAIIAELADIFTGEVGMTPEEMIVLESVLLDAADFSLSVGDFALALDVEDALLDLHTLKLTHLVAGSVLRFWERFSQIRG